MKKQSWVETFYKEIGRPDIKMVSMTKKELRIALNESITKWEDMDDRAYSKSDHPCGLCVAFNKEYYEHSRNRGPRNHCIRCPLGRKDAGSGGDCCNEWKDVHHSIGKLVDKLKELRTILD